MLPKFTHMYRLTRDPESRFTADGKQICNLGLAASEKWGDRESKLFIDATAFGKTAEFISQVRKGQRVLIHGKLETQQWQDSASGQNRSKAALIVDGFEYVEKREEGQQPAQNQAPQQQAPAQQNNAMPDNMDDNIPFLQYQRGMIV